MENNNEHNNARELYNQVRKGDISVEQAVSIVGKDAGMAKLLSNVMIEDVKQHKELSEAEHESIDKLTDLMKAVWSDSNASPEQKQAQCDKILEQQEKILNQKKSRQDRHETRKDYAFLTICLVLVTATVCMFGKEGTNKNDCR